MHSAKRGLLGMLALVVLCIVPSSAYAGPANDMCLAVINSKPADYYSPCKSPVFVAGQIVKYGGLNCPCSEQTPDGKTVSGRCLRAGYCLGVKAGGQALQQPTVPRTAVPTAGAGGSDSPAVPAVGGGTGVPDGDRTPSVISQYFPQYLPVSPEATAADALTRLGTEAFTDEATLNTRASVSPTGEIRFSPGSVFQTESSIRGPAGIVVVDGGSSPGEGGFWGGSASTFGGGNVGGGSVLPWWATVSATIQNFGGFGGGGDGAGFASAINQRWSEAFRSPNLAFPMQSPSYQGFGQVGPNPLPGTLISPTVNPSLGIARADFIQQLTGGVSVNSGSGAPQTQLPVLREITGRTSFYDPQNPAENGGCKAGTCRGFYSDKVIRADDGQVATMNPAKIPPGTVFQACTSAGCTAPLIASDKGYYPGRDTDLPNQYMKQLNCDGVCTVTYRVLAEAPALQGRLDTVAYFNQALPMVAEMRAAPTDTGVQTYADAGIIGRSLSGGVSDTGRLGPEIIASAEYDTGFAYARAPEPEPPIVRSAISLLDTADTPMLPSRADFAEIAVQNPGVVAVEDWSVPEPEIIRDVAPEIDVPAPVPITDSNFEVNEPPAPVNTGPDIVTKALASLGSFEYPPPLPLIYTGTLLPQGLPDIVADQPAQDLETMAREEPAVAIAKIDWSDVPDPGTADGVPEIVDLSPDESRAVVEAMQRPEPDVVPQDEPKVVYVSPFDGIPSVDEVVALLPERPQFFNTLNEYFKGTPYDFAVEPPEPLADKFSRWANDAYSSVQSNIAEYFAQDPAPSVALEAKPVDDISPWSFADAQQDIRTPFAFALTEEGLSITERGPFTGGYYGDLGVPYPAIVDSIGAGDPPVEVAAADSAAVPPAPERATPPEPEAEAPPEVPPPKDDPKAPPEVTPKKDDPKKDSPAKDPPKKDPPAPRRAAAPAVSDAKSPSDSPKGGGGMPQLPELPKLPGGGGGSKAGAPPARQAPTIAQQVASSVFGCPIQSQTLTSVLANATNPICGSAAQIPTVTSSTSPAIAALSDGKIHIALITTGSELSWAVVAPTSDITVTITDAEQHSLLIGGPQGSFSTPHKGAYTLTATAGRETLSKTITL